MTALKNLKIWHGSRRGKKKKKRLLTPKHRSDNNMRRPGMEKLQRRFQCRPESQCLDTERHRARC